MSGKAANPAATTRSKHRRQPRGTDGDRLDVEGLSSWGEQPLPTAASRHPPRQRVDDRRRGNRSAPSNSSVGTISQTRGHQPEGGCTRSLIALGHHHTRWRSAMGIRRRPRPWKQPARPGASTPGSTPRWEGPGSGRRVVAQHRVGRTIADLRHAFHADPLMGCRRSRTIREVEALGATVKAQWVDTPDP